MIKGSDIIISPPGGSEPPSREPNFWQRWGFRIDPGNSAPDALSASLPEGIVAIFPADPAHNATTVNTLKSMGVPPRLAFKVSDVPYCLFRVDDDAVIAALKAIVAPGVTVAGPGEQIVLPANMAAGTEKQATCPEELSCLIADHLAALALPPEPELDPIIIGNPLSQFSLRGKADEFANLAVEPQPLLGSLCLAGQATVWYAPPNAGKTLVALKLLMDAVAERRITPDNVYYINMDDSSAGFATKIRLMDDLGVHTIAPGYQGFEPSMLPELFVAMAGRQTAKGALIIIDTVKKVTSLMDKTKASHFTQTCRAAVMAGATILGFAHTNKQPAASGKLQFGGTTDLRDDFDACFIMGPVEEDGFAGEKVVSFECIKNRGPSARSVAYTYTDSESASYAERLASVRPLDPDELIGFRRIEEEKEDSEVIASIQALIGSQQFAKMPLAKAASKQAGISERAAIRVIEKYTGTDPAQAKWYFERKARGAMIYSLHPSPMAPPDST